MVATNVSLQEKVYETWIGIHDIHSALRQYSNAASDRDFQQEVSGYGDLAEPETWQKAFAALKARFLAAAATDDGQFLIEFHLVTASQKEGWSDLALAVVEQMLMIPAAIASLEKGWASIQTNGCEYGAEESEVRYLMTPLAELGDGEKSGHYQEQRRRLG